MSFSLLVVQVKRMDSAPEVNGAKPCIVSFAAWKDKENVLRQAKLLKGCGIYITEDVSHKNGESPLSLSRLSSPWKYWLLLLCTARNVCSGYSVAKTGPCRACSLLNGSCVGAVLSWSRGGLRGGGEAPGTCCPCLGSS